MPETAVCAVEKHADRVLAPSYSGALELLLQAGGQPPDGAAFEKWVERRDLDAYHRSDEYADYDDE